MGGARKEGTTQNLGGTREEAGGGRSFRGASFLRDTRKEAGGGRSLRLTSSLGVTSKGVYRTLGGTRKDTRVNRSLGGTTGTSLGGGRGGTVR